MAKGGGSRARSGGASRGGSRGSGKDAGSPRRRAAPAKRGGAAPAAAAASAPDAELPSAFALGAVPGATPGKWIDTWRERMPRVELVLVPIAVHDQRAALLSGAVDVAIVRLPIDRDGLHVIPLYEEKPVVVVAKDSHLTAADELELADLAGEVVVVPADDVLGPVVPGALSPAFDPPATTGDAIAVAAAGVGAVIVPMSLARLHHRRDAASVPLADGPVSAVGLAWPADRTTPLVETFVGIVRGRTAHSTRG